MSPLDNALSSAEQPEEIGGPWGLAARPPDGESTALFPLAPFAVRQVLDDSTLEEASAAWRKATTFITGPLDEFPETVHQEEPCKLGECLHGLRPVQEHRLNSISQELRLALRHSGLSANGHLCFSLVCGVEVKYSIIGGHDWTHNLRCDVILCSPVGRTDVPFELAIQREVGSSVKAGWCVIQSEHRLFVEFGQPVCSTLAHICFAYRARADMVC